MQTSLYIYYLSMQGFIIGTEAESAARSYTDCLDGFLYFDTSHRMFLNCILQVQIDTNKMNKRSQMFCYFLRMVGCYAHSSSGQI